MKETQILYSGPMVLQVLDDTKWQTRRLVKGEALKWLQPGMFTPEVVANPENGLCPYGKVGDHLWVRETWQHSNHPYGPYDEDCMVFYRADFLNDVHGPDGERSPEGRYRTWRPSIHMPRTASRITLEITGVRVERLQDISPDDCIAEGAWPIEKRELGRGHEAVAAFRALWEEIHGPIFWAVNPWVWVLEFRRLVQEGGAQ